MFEDFAVRRPLQVVSVLWCLVGGWIIHTFDIAVVCQGHPEHLFHSEIV